MQKDLIKSLTEYFNNDDNILFVYLFGSYACETQKDTSDIDIAVFLNDNDYYVYKVKKKVELENIFKKEVDIIILNDAPPLLKHQVFEHGKLLKCDDRDFLKEYKIKSLYEYFDYTHVSNIIFESNKKRIIEEVQDGRQKYSVKED